MDVDLPVLYVDPDFVVVDKPAGMLSVPGRGPDKQDCVESRVRQLFPDCPRQPAVHRLDMDTSGLLLLARTAPSHRLLSAQFAERRVVKKYIAVVEGLVEQEEGRIALAFRLDPDNRPRQVYDQERGKLGITLWRRCGSVGGRTRIAFTPLTGRTHQLRLHAAHPLGLNCPIVGDRLYGLRRAGERMLLHARGLEFFHPRSELPLSFSSPVPF